MASNIYDFVLKEDFEYEMKWRYEVALFFLQYTTAEAWKGNYRYGACISDYLFNVQFLMYHKFREFFTFDYFCWKLGALEKRSKLDQPAVVYDEKYKRVYASDEQWVEFMKVTFKLPKNDCISYIYMILIFCHNVIWTKFDPRVIM